MGYYDWDDEGVLALGALILRRPHRGTWAFSGKLFSKSGKVNTSVEPKTMILCIAFLTCVFVHFLLSVQAPPRWESAVGF